MPLFSLVYAILFASQGQSFMPALSKMHYFQQVASKMMKSGMPLSTI